MLIMFAAEVKRQANAWRRRPMLPKTEPMMDEISNTREPAKPASRFAPLTPETMSDDQRRLAEAISAFSLNGIRGPFNMMLRSPEAAARFQAMGSYLRFHTGLDEHLVELAILVHARVWNDEYEWSLHAPRAAKAGLSPPVIDAIRLGNVPAALAPDEEIVFRYAAELELFRRVDEKTFRSAFDLLGERGVTDFVFMLGQYATISLILAVSGDGLAPNDLPPVDRPFAQYPAPRR
ncbi:MAG: carboxymuconolactone decarboxylase family protein [Rhizomicrobium sp.]